MTTQKAFFSYEEVIDLHTESEKVSVIGIHTPTGDTPRKLCPGFFQQFRKYKYLGCSIALVPAATLPADPSQLSYSAGEPVIDSRDMLNPILFHGCHGNDLGNILNRIYSAGSSTASDLSEFLHSDSLDLWNLENNTDSDNPFHGTNILESLYYRALTDKTWKKANVQRGFRKAGLRPRIYSLATNMQIQNAVSLSNEFRAPAPFTADENDEEVIASWDFEDSVANPVRYFTPRTVPLGWLDTRNVLGYEAADDSLVPDAALNSVIKNIVGGATEYAELPKIFMGVIMLPPAYKTEMYFRMIINHYFAFAGFRGISLANEMLENPNYSNWNEMLTEGGSDDPVDPPEPEPPTPTYEYPCVVLTTGDGDFYRKAEYYDAEGVKKCSLSFLGVQPSNADQFIINSDNGLVQAQWDADKGTYDTQTVWLVQSPSVSSEIALRTLVNGSPANVDTCTTSSEIAADISRNLTAEKYSLDFTGTGLYDMFLEDNIYEE